MTNPKALCERLRGELAEYRLSYKAKYDAWDHAVSRAERAEALLRECAKELQNQMRGSTHWEGCENAHPVCLLLKRIAALLGEKP